MSSTTEMRLRIAHLNRSIDSVFLSFILLYFGSERLARSPHGKADAMSKCAGLDAVAVAIFWFRKEGINS
jgi:hypothetical protein